MAAIPGAGFPLDRVEQGLGDRSGGCPGATEPGLRGFTAELGRRLAEKLGRWFPLPDVRRT